MPLYVGLMSGTSADGVEAALVDIDDRHIAFRQGTNEPFPAPLRNNIQSVASGDYGTGDGIDAMGALDTTLGRFFAETLERLLEQAGIPADAIAAIGHHGQTIRHRPDEPAPFTLQVGDPNVIAAQTGITTVADFRRRDVALGGQGAPLAPAFHDAIFSDANETRAILNLGGIANLTILPPGKPVTGFDTGPANTLLDAWAARHGYGSYDQNGALARAGRCHDQLLNALLADAYFQRDAPKSTGPEYFHLDWLDSLLATLAEAPTPADVQATLVELTAQSVATAINHAAPAIERLFVCGGGVHNPAVMKALQTSLPGLAISSTSGLDVDPDYVEAMAFAWLAHRTASGQTGNLPAVTGAQAASILGAIYPAP